MQSIGGNAVIIKEININFVRKVLKAKGQATKQDIARETGLSFVTVGTALQHLLEENEIFETKLAQSNGGRPAQQYSYNYDYAYGLVLYTYESENKTYIHSSVINLAGNIIEELDTEAVQININSFEEIIMKLINKYPLIKVISIGHHGVESNGEIIMSEYKLLEGVNFSEYFANLNLPIILENDVYSAVLGFSKRREIRPDEILVYLYFPENHHPSAGILINGVPFKGKSNYAGEIVNMPLDINWNSSLYQNQEKVIEAITKLITSICSLLNPHTFILNGSFLDKFTLNSVNQLCKEKMTQNLMPKMYISENFMKDYKSGLVMKAIEQLEPNIALTKKKNNFE